MSGNSQLARRRGRTVCVAAAVLSAGLSPCALAGGSPESTLLIINPASAESMYLGNYYKQARGIPDCNVVYLDPAPASTPGNPTYADFTGANSTLDAVLGQLKIARLDDHIDFIVVASGGNFFVSAPNYVVDGCWPVARFSQSTIFTMAYIKSQILAGNVASGLTNQYYSSSTTPQPFNSRTAWLGGNPSTSGSARRYFVCAQLGYTGSLGNTPAEITAMIDRSVLADGTRPAGTFYFMNTTDAARNVRAPQFPGAISAITGAGGQAAVLNGVLPEGLSDCLGVLTGWADPAIDTSTMTLIPGAFGDHLTSYAATFDTSQQSKMSQWIRKGASGTSGTVEEPCNYTQKFVAANFHNLYYQGMALGEAWLRSMGFVPFQSLLIGDPLCRPFARFSTVSGNAPLGAVSGGAFFTPTAVTPAGVSIGSYELYIDGVLHSRRNAGEQFAVKVDALPEGAHEWTVLAYDNTPARTVSRWKAAFTSSYAGHSVAANLASPSGDVTTLFTVNATASAGATELRLLHNGRVVAASQTSPASLQVYGRNLGTGTGRLQVEATFGDRRTARSAFIPVTVSSVVGPLNGQPPVATGYSKRLAPGVTAPVELPARFDDPIADTTWTIVTPPSFATISTNGKGYRVLTPAANACGPDLLTYRVQTPSGVSNTATVNLFYDTVYACRADMDGDSILTVMDFSAYLNAYVAANPRADFNADCALNVADFTAFLQAYTFGCP
jgi:hypothetical protein